MREVYIDDERREATVIVPDDQLALAIGKEGLNARLAYRLTGWKIDIKSDSEFAQQEAAAAYGGEDDEEFTGRCAAVLSNGKRCPNAALPGSRFCGIAAHRELAEREARGEDISDSIVHPVSAEPEEDEAAEAGDAEEVAPVEEQVAEVASSADEATAAQPAEVEPEA